MFVAYTLELNASHIMKKLSNSCCVTVAVHIVMTTSRPICCLLALGMGENQLLHQLYLFTQLFLNGKIRICWCMFSLFRFHLCFDGHKYFVEKVNNSWHDSIYLLQNLKFNQMCIHSMFLFPCSNNCHHPCKIFLRLFEWLPSSVLWRQETGEPAEKPSEQGENQQWTQPT